MKTKRELDKINLANEATRYESDSLYNGTIDGKLIDMERDIIKLQQSVDSDVSNEGIDKRIEQLITSSREKARRYKDDLNKLKNKGEADNKKTKGK